MPTARINGIDLAYERHGRGSPVVLVAGFSVDRNVWQPVIPALAQHHDVIVFDNRGAGQSSAPDQPYTTELLAADAVALLRELDLPAAHFVGSSYGGCIVLEIARRHPELVRSAVTVCSFVKASMLTQYGLLRLEMLDARTADHLVGRFLAIVGLSNGFMNVPGNVELMLAAGPQPIARAGLKNQLEAMLAFDAIGWLGDVECPALLIGADEDILADVADTRLMASVIRNSEMHCFDAVGHLPMLEKPEMFNALTLDFLRRHDE